MSIANQAAPNNIPLALFHSEKLFKLFERNWPLKLEELNKTISLAIDYGGLEEIGYERIEGSSYNPKLARIPLIVFDLGEKTDIETILSAILFGTEFSNLKKDEYLSKIAKIHSSHIFNLTKESFELKESIISQNLNNHEKYSSESIILNLCLFLDRFRHAHLANQNELELSIKIFPHIINLIPNNLKIMELQFLSWHKRTIINQNNKLKQE